MHIACDEKRSTLTLIPVDQGEKDSIDTIIKRVTVGGKSEYAGRGSYPDDPDGENVTVHLTFKDDQWLRLFGTSKADRHAVDDIRNMCYYSTGALIFMGKIEVDGATAIVVTHSYCKLCNEPMASAFQAESKTCDACAEKCEHTFTYGFVHGPGIPIGTGEYCSKCMRKKLGQPPKSPVQHLIDAALHSRHHHVIDGII